MEYNLHSNHTNTFSVVRCVVIHLTDYSYFVSVHGIYRAMYNYNNLKIQPFSAEIIIIIAEEDFGMKWKHWVKF